MRLFTLMLIWVLALLPAVAQQPSPVTDNFLIVPGKQIGSAILGDRIKKVIDVLGPPDVYDLAKGVQEFTWLLEPKPKSETPPESPRVFYVNTTADTVEKIVLVMVAGDPQYTTADGLHVGSTDQEVQDKLGAPTQVGTGTNKHVLLYASGIIFVTSDKQGDSLFRVATIRVISPRCFETVPPRDLCTVRVGHGGPRSRSYSLPPPAPRLAPVMTSA